jgi:hypothetical protein
MGLKAGWLALFLFVWIIGAFLGSTFEYQSSEGDAGVAYSTGTATFTNGSTTVTGAGTTWVAAMEDGNIKADTDAIWTKIETVVNNTELTLYSPYTGTGGAGLAYTMAVSPGWAGTGSGGYSESPVTTLEYLTNLSNAFQRLPLLGNIPLPIPNGEYFKAAYKVVTWQWSFMDGYEMIYWIFFAPFVVMGVLSMILLVYGIISGNLTLG